jgi:EAL domain-containing protein (putative c-di-GMP-specific phosphodiesterase class I)/ActR/RegA family two-component response regulator
MNQIAGDRPNVRVLVVEDDPVDQESIRRMVEERSLAFELTMASSTAEAKTRLLAHEFDVVVADYLLEDGTVLDLFRFVPKIPVIVITGVGDEGTALWAIRAGAQDYLVKDKAGDYLKLLPGRIEAAVQAQGVEAQAQLLARALLRTNHAVFLTDLQGVILFTNETFHRQYGYSYQEILGKPASMLGGVSEDGLQMHHHKDGSTFPVFLHMSTLKNDTGTEVAILHFAYPERSAESEERERNEVSDAVSLEGRMTEALENEEFLLHFQPIYRLSDGKMTSLEALLRWKNPRFGLVMPIQFVPALERTGFIIRIGEWVLRKVCLQQRDWQRQHFDLVPVAVNLSYLQFQDPNLIPLVERLMREFSLPREAIVLEIKESSLAIDLATSRQILIEMQQHGLRVCLDNATGALGESLAELPVEMLKLDVSLAQNLASKKAVMEKVKEILSMAHALKITTIAKGVETREQQNAFNELGCQMGQGFYYQLPLPMRDLEKLLESEKKREEQGKHAPGRFTGGIIP